jgi:type I restriction enzyme M protein
LTGSHLQVCVSYLEEYKLFNSNLDVVDEAFEHLINQSSKGEKGQYFTPRWVIDLCVKMLNPQEHETMIDTAARSSGFTVHTIFKVWQDILVDEGVAASHLFSLQKKPPRCYDYVRNKIFAIDFDEKAVRVARCLNLIAGDGQTNVLQLNTLDFKRWDHTVKEEAWNDTFLEGWKKLRKLLKTKGDYREFNFDVLMANPPFAGDIKQGDMLALYELGRKENGKSESKVGRDLLFIERNLDFLRPGGRMAVVLPQGRFNNSSDQRVRRYIAERCRILGVVGLDGNTFKPHTGTKTSVLLVQKWNDDPTVGPLCPKVDDYNIFFATQRVPAKDTSGEKIIAKDAQGNPMVDSHGHWIVQHDLFNVDGLTHDGIAEAFQEFAKKEGLSFFLTGSFDETRYRGLLEGLEITEILLSELERTFRIDAEFFHKHHLEYWARIQKNSHESINSIAKISDGNHFSISDRFQQDGIPYYRGQDVVGHFFIEQSSPICINKKTFNETHMHRSHLKKGDVLLSIVGTIGELSLVTSDQLATCSCKLAILRTKQISPPYLATFLSSTYGKSQIQRYTRGAVQMGFLLEDMDQIHIPRFQPKFENAVSGFVEKAQHQLDDSKKIYEQAENTLLAELDLLDWQPPEALSYERKASEAFAVERLDAEHFKPKYYAALKELEKKGASQFMLMDELLVSLTNGHTPLRHDLEIGDVTFLCAEHVKDFRISYDSDKRILQKHHDTELNRTQLKNGDVLMTIKGRVGNAAIVEKLLSSVNINQDVALLRLKSTLPHWYLISFLNSPFGKLMVEQYSTGQINPFLGLGNLRKLPIPVFSNALMEKVAKETELSVKKALAAQNNAKNLLERAKRAVEIAIETDETTALDYLNQPEEAHYDHN